MGYGWILKSVGLKSMMQNEACLLIIYIKPHFHTQSPNNSPN